jgi:translocation and assembly module TamA
MLTLPIGGNGMIDGSFEIRYSVTQSLRLAAFVDFGQVTRGRLGPGDVAHGLWAVGIGFRYLTPIGPIRLDLARRLPFGRLPPLYAIDAMTGAIVDRPYTADDSCFGIGGSGVDTPVSDSLCALHISIGEAF